ncbi:facilitated trehalose transporter Tret1-like [Bicyclus anynana]|uniref:Facilitated trehalose transporter Tret1-like n=1 Tax=Bicyclus anynana TaxID=110368 RepID=A0ABM3M0M1_BICAN|nr:facilitated trehalose transporter Tret1-like [Bicyclus anynana]
MGSAVLTAAQNIAMLCCGRLLLGFSGGIINVMVVVYIGEIASTHIRGVLLTAIGNDDKATEVLQDLGRADDVDKILESKQEYTERSNKQDWKELFDMKTNRKALFIAATINVLQNCSGLLSVVYFSASIFEMAESSIPSNISMIIIVGFQLLGSIITPFFVERTGRKRILSLSCVACCISMFVLGLYFYLNELESPVIDNLKWLPLVVLVVYFISYNFGYGIIPHIIIGELFTPNVRSNGSTLSFSIAWVFGFIVNTVFGMVLDTVGGHSAFWFFAIVCACACVFTIFYVPETKGKSLLEIQELLSR